MTRISKLLKTAVRRVLPRPLWNRGKGLYYRLLAIKYRSFGRPFKPAETSKAKARRAKEGFFELYCQGRGLDIGFGGDPVTPESQGWDYEHGDAQQLAGQADSSFDFVYSSHTLEHMIDPEVALKNWWKVLRAGGHLILYLPHRDLYEKKSRLPSNWNNDHKHFFLPERDDPPDTLGVVPLLQRALSKMDLIYVKICDDGHTVIDPGTHSDGEYSIEVVAKKL